MRYNITKQNSTKSERIFYEILKEMRIPFKHRWIIEGKEVDFLIFDKYCIEINGHSQDGYRNEFLINKGYIPVHLENNDVKYENIEKLINRIKGQNKIK